MSVFGLQENIYNLYNAINDTNYDVSFSKSDISYSVITSYGLYWTLQVLLLSWCHHMVNLAFHRKSDSVIFVMYYLCCSLSNEPMVILKFTYEKGKNIQNRACHQKIIYPKPYSDVWMKNNFWITFFHVSITHTEEFAN